MPHTDSAPCRFTFASNKEGQPGTLEIELINKPLPALERLRIYFSLEKGTLWKDVETLVDQLNKRVTTMNVTEKAPCE
jgi:hypothetical protein